MKSTQSYIFTLLFCCFLMLQYGFLLGQIQPPENWHQLDRSTDRVNGIAVQQAYAVLAKVNPKPVIVAIIDSGVDIYHEDLHHAIWVNADEIPDNGIDDDHNGYIDDIHGWNFIGGVNGENVDHETLEITRLYGKLHRIYGHMAPQDIKRKNKDEYELYLHAKSEVETNRAKILKALKPIKTEERIILSAFETLRENLGTDTIQIAELKKIEDETEPLLDLGRQIVLGLAESEMDFKTYSEIEQVAKEEYAAKTESYRIKLDYSFNHTYNSRVSIVGDDYENSFQRYYGNNDVIGPDAFHGTHVAGIIAANRYNNIGTQGIAKDALIMSIRTVPDGDERDKDVANAIRYAVDNGASIINMSFGKYYSWDKKVVDAALKYAEERDVLIIHAAGNNSNDNDSKIHYPTDQYDRKWFLGRKEAKNWVEVGALSWHPNNRAVAGFSNYGKADVDVFAPGVAIKSTAPNGQYATANGTSMAAPVVAGIAAILRSYFPKLTAPQIKEILIQSSFIPNYKVSLPGDQKLVNLSDISVAGGMVDAYRSVRLAMKTKGKKKKRLPPTIRP